ncbi:MAG: hypothetical protein AAGC64_11325, partial [Bacteroidota bacterium]
PLNKKKKNNGHSLQASDWLGQIKPGANFVTREAPGIGSNTGGAIEVVTDPNAVKIETFNMLDFN